MRVAIRCGLPAWLLQLALALCSSAAAARPYEVADMLRVESYGQVKITPDGATAIVERRDRYDGATRYTYGYYVRRLLTRLYRLDLRNGRRLVPLFAQRADAGYWMGDFSPSGTRLAVFRLADDRLSAGVVDLTRGTVRWFAIAPDLPPASPSPVWDGEDQLLYVAFRTAALPQLLSYGEAVQRRSTALWKAGAAGKVPSRLLLGTGAYDRGRAASSPRVLVSVDTSTGASRKLYQGDVTDFSLSQDRTCLAIVEAGEVVPLDADVPIDPTFERRRSRLVLIDRTTGIATRPCRQCDLLRNMLAWSPTGRQLLLFARHDEEPWTAGSFFRVDSSGNVRPIKLPEGLRPALLAGDGSFRVANGAWRGGEPILRVTSRGGRSDWLGVSEKGPAHLLTTGLSQSPDLIAIHGGTLFAVSGALWANRARGWTKLSNGRLLAATATLLDRASVGVRRLVNSPGERSIFALEELRKRVSLTLFDPGGRPVRRCPLPGRTFSVLALDRRTGVAILYRADQGIGRLFRLRCGTAPVPIDVVNAHLAAIDDVSPVAVPSRSADGRLLTHWLFLPKGVSSPPLVVIPYPGEMFGTQPPVPSFDLQAAVNVRLLVAHGYAVLQPSLPIASGPDGPLPAIVKGGLAAIDAAIATHRVDAGRVAIYGHSYGGYAALALAASGRRFAAVIASAAAANLLAGYGDTFDFPDDPATPSLSVGRAAGWYEGGQGQMGGPPWRMPELYLRNSPLFGVEAVSSPVLLIHGDVDGVPVFQSEQMFFALLRTGKDALLLRYAGEGHALSSPANIRDQWKHIFAFLDERFGAAASSVTDSSAAPSPRSSHRPLEGERADSAAASVR